MDGFGSIPKVYVRLMQIFGYTQLTSRNRQLVRSKFLLVYSSVLLISTVSWLIYAVIRMQYKTNPLGSNQVGRIIDYAQMVGIGIAYTVTMVETMVHHRKQRRQFEKLKEIDGLFKSVLKVDTGWATNGKEVGLTCLLMFSAYFLFSSYTLGFNLYLKEFSTIEYWALYTILSKLCALRYFELYAIVTAFKWRLTKLNECLQGLKLSTKKLMDLDNPKKLKFGFYHTEVYLQKTNLESASHHQLDVLRRIYYHLWDLNKIFNQSFGLSLLVNIANDFILMTAKCWALITMQATAVGLVEYLRLLAFILSLIPHGFNIILICRACFLAAQSATKSALLVHKIPVDSDNHKQNFLIEEFSLQLLHQKIAFNAVGFFNIDMSLLYTIAGATTTYLVILIQFYVNSKRG
ncbi:unnamed protein product [Hermetia illucens]|uniref:Gustatory receptor n=1 Tax=Hermetia illucens TaxID=343691 RepID=A0A7R8UTB6_HERIL|nr:putative gustatory receptor 2a [Hermetia illucens]CAD7086684.1 unnamed protein product [Hermetia illucens]